MYDYIWFLRKELIWSGLVKIQPACYESHKSIISTCAFSIVKLYTFSDKTKQILLHFINFPKVLGKTGA